MKTSPEPPVKKQRSAKNRILIVEDNFIAGTVANILLTKLGCQVEITENGMDAVSKTQANHYDLIFMDIGLPDIDGYETTKRIRLQELNRGTRTPIIALTAHVDQENKQRCLDVGMNAVLTKPLSKEKAGEILRDFIPRFSPLNNQLPKESQEYDLFADESQILDFPLALKQANGQKALVKELFGLFLNSIPEEKQQIENARQKENWLEISAISHKLKSSASYCAANRLKEACSLLEGAIKQKNKENFQELYSLLINEIAAVEKALQDNLEKAD